MGNGAYSEGGAAAESRPPRLSDLAKVAAELNRLGARYLVVGGFAIIQAGYPRFTNDIDLLIEASLENEAKVFEALRTLPDRAVDQLKSGDVARYIVVRIADEVLIDLLQNSCGVTYNEAIADHIIREVDGVPIPFASPRMLLRMKQTVREKDIPDRLFLEGLLKDDKTAEGQKGWKGGLPLWLQKLFGNGKK